MNTFPYNPTVYVIAVLCIWVFGIGLLTYGIQKGGLRMLKTDIKNWLYRRKENHGPKNRIKHD